MSMFWWIILIGVIMWFILSSQPKSKRARSFNAIDEAEYWLKTKGVSIESVRFSSYENPILSRVPGSVILVGYGKMNDGELGFAIEVKLGKGVVDSEIIQPSGLASHHKTAAMQAEVAGIPLLKMLSIMANEHHEKRKQKTS